MEPHLHSQKLISTSLFKRTVSQDLFNIFFFWAILRLILTGIDELAIDDLTLHQEIPPSELFRTSEIDWCITKSHHLDTVVLKTKWKVRIVYRFILYSKI